MNTSGEVADLFVKEGIQVTEESVKLMALGAKNLAALLWAAAQDNNKLQGKTNLKQLLKAEKPLCIMQIKETDIKDFSKEAKRYGVLFTAVRDKTNKSGICDIIAKQEDVAKLNYITEKLGCAVPTQTEEKTEPKPDKENTEKSEKSKNSQTRTDGYRSESKYPMRGETEQEKNKQEKKRMSVKAKIAEIKARSKHKEPPRHIKNADKSRG